MSLSLSAVLSSTGPNYQDLFKPGKVLEKKGDGWALTCKKIPEKRKAVYFSNLMNHLYLERDLDGVNGAALAYKINEFVFKDVPGFLPSPVIRFKSSEPFCSFLSNFEHTAIFVAGKFFPHAELAYQYLISCEIDMPAATHEFSVVPKTPLDAKKIGAKIERICGPVLGKGVIEGLKKTRLQLMEDVEEAKFSQNRYLRVALLATGSSELREDTTDPLFAGNEGCENALSQILHKVRQRVAST